MYNKFTQFANTTSTTRVIDVGVTPDRTLKDSNYFEHFYPYKSQLTATSIEDAAFLEEQYPGLKFFRTNGKELPFTDKTFDVAISSAVLEHVGTREQQQQFIAEVLRVADRFFITTPNRQFPVEFHTLLPFIHWLPQPLHQKLLSKLGLKFWASTSNLNLLTPKSLLSLFPPEAEVQLYKYRLLGLPSNLVAYGYSNRYQKSTKA
jgi:SAM-dependent methyltransferase